MTFKMQRFIKTSSFKPWAVLFFPILTTILVFFACFTSYHHHDKDYPAEDKDQSTTKYVLYWNRFWSSQDHEMVFGFEPFKDCQYKNCLATARRSLIPLEKFDAVVFHAQSYSREKHGVPWNRSPHQVYVFMNMEAPVDFAKITPYASFYNWSMTYRFDSDIVKRHGYVIKEKTSYTMPSPEVLDNKEGLVAWFVNHCPTNSLRETIADELQKFVPLDVYGACGNLRCHGNNSWKGSLGKCNYETAEKKYKFYLSFENSYCTDYSTAKLYGVLEKDLVPVVYSGDKNTLSTPPNSVINVEDFESVEKLADYLKYLDLNDEKYLKYFEWKKDYKVVTSQESSACQICKKLNEPIKQSIYTNIREWWRGNNNSMCKLKNVLPKIVTDFLDD